MSEYIVPAIGRAIAGQEQYIKHLHDKLAAGDTSCDLCGRVEFQDRNSLYPQIGGRAIILTSQNFTLIENDFPYEAYDGQQIITHHMLVPREHISFDAIKQDRTLRHDFADAEAEALELAEGAYGTVMARTSGSLASSIKTHAHEHLFVTGEPVIEHHFSVENGYNDFRFSEK